MEEYGNRDIFPQYFGVNRGQEPAPNVLFSPATGITAKECSAHSFTEDFMFPGENVVNVGKAEKTLGGVGRLRQDDRKTDDRRP